MTAHVPRVTACFKHVGSKCKKEAWLQENLPNSVIPVATVPGTQLEHSVELVRVEEEEMLDDGMLVERNVWRGRRMMIQAVFKEG